MNDIESKLPGEPRPGGPFRHPASASLLAILSTADVLGRELSRTIEPFGITAQQFNVLRILRGSHPDGLAISDIGDRMIHAHPNVTRLVDRVEEKGLAVRERCGDDRRVVRCWISDDGLELLSTMDQPMMEMSARLARCLGPDEHELLINMLDRVRSTGE